jgi:hypothetical protein
VLNQYTNITYTLLLAVLAPPSLRFLGLMFSSAFLNISNSALPISIAGQPARYRRTI